MSDASQCTPNHQPTNAVLCVLMNRNSFIRLSLCTDCDRMLLLLLMDKTQIDEPLLMLLMLYDWTRYNLLRVPHL